MVCNDGMDMFCYEIWTCPRLEIYAGIEKATYHHKELKSTQCLVFPYLLLQSSILNIVVNFNCKVLQACSSVVQQLFKRCSKMHRHLCSCNNVARQSKNLSVPEVSQVPRLT